MLAAALLRAKALTCDLASGSPHSHVRGMFILLQGRDKLFDNLLCNYRYIYLLYNNKH